MAIAPLVIKVNNYITVVYRHVAPLRYGMTVNYGRP